MWILKNDYLQLKRWKLSNPSTFKAMLTIFDLYDRSQCEEQADFAEKVGSFFLMPACLAFGHQFQLRDQGPAIIQGLVSTVARVAAYVFYLLLLPLTLSMTLVGLAIRYFSTSYSTALIERIDSFQGDLLSPIGSGNKVIAIPEIDVCDKVEELPSTPIPAHNLETLLESKVVISVKEKHLLVRQLLKALIEVHSKDSYGHLSPQNIFYNKENDTLQLSIVSDPEQGHNVHLYSAPEAIHTPLTNPEQDIWTLGLLIARILFKLEDNPTVDMKWFSTISDQQPAIPTDFVIPESLKQQGYLHWDKETLVVSEDFKERYPNYCLLFVEQSDIDDNLETIEQNFSKSIWEDQNQMVSLWRLVWEMLQLDPKKRPTAMSLENKLVQFQS